ncbi:hypothetical protein F4818DRAFT_311897 [Hypoxylon cercidicola]|nr:hypothetical protein F4818DRAFT_311897 [Hypoxylon cercidicola]
MVALVDALTFVQMEGIVIDSHYLVAQQRLLFGSQLPLPSNQWQVEVWSWHAATMAAVQYRLIQQRLLEGVVPMLNQLGSITPEERAFCSGQRVSSRAVSGFTNVFALSLFLIISLGSLIIVTSLFLDRVVGMISPVRQRLWINDNALHLQRLAYMNQERVEDKQVSTWTDIDKDTPRVEGETLLGPLVEPETEKISHESKLGQRYINLPQQDLDSMTR